MTQQTDELVVFDMSFFNRAACQIYFVERWKRLSENIYTINGKNKDTSFYTTFSTHYE